MNIHRMGNKFYVEGDDREAAYVSIDGDYCGKRDKVELVFAVNFSTHGSAPAEIQRPYAQAILAACDYAALCPGLFKGWTAEAIRDHWRQEEREGFPLVDEWFKARKKKKH